MKRLGGLIALLVGMVGCSPPPADVDATALATVSSSVLSTYTCDTYSDHTQYDSLASCQILSGSFCSSEWVTFPNKGVSLCYIPTPGWESCLPPHAPAQWQYTAYNLAGGAPGGYRIIRSLIGCSSTICKCTGAVTTSSILTYADYSALGCPNGSGCSIVILPMPYTTGLAWTMTDNSSVPLSGTASTETVAKISVAGTMPSLELKLFTDIACTTQTGSTATLDANGATTSPITTAAFSGAGEKFIYFTLKNTLSNHTTDCTYSGLHYTLISTPLVVANPLIFPTQQKKPVGGVAGTFTLNFYNSNTGSNAGMTYDSTYTWDRQVDGSAASTTLPGTVDTSELASKGILKWTPTSAEFGPYEICVRGYNAAAPSGVIGCAVVNVEPLIHTTSLVQYWDAQFATTAGGQGTNVPVTSSIRNLVDASAGTLNGFSYSTSSGWKGNITPTSTLDENALVLDGTNDYVDFGNILEAYTSETIDAWIRPLDTSQSGVRYIFSHGNATIGTGGRGLSLYQVNNGPVSSLTLSIGDNPSATNIYCTAATKLASYTWYHVTASWNSATFTLNLYINGSLAKGCTATNYAGVLSGSGSNLRVGYSPSGSAPTNYWKGAIANMRVYAGASSDSTIASTNYAAEKVRFAQADTVSGVLFWAKADGIHYWDNNSNSVYSDGFSGHGTHVNTWPDLSGNVHHAVSRQRNFTTSCGFSTCYFTSPTAQLTASQINGKPVLRFDDSNLNAFDVTLPKKTGYTVFVVGKVTTSNPTVANPFLTTTGAATTSAYSFAMRGSGMASPGFLDSYYGNEAAQYFYGTTTSGQYTFGASEYSIFEKAKVSGGTETFYRNGTSLGFIANVSDTFSSAGSHSTYYLGTNPSGNYLNGDIAEIIVYDSTLTAADRLFVERYLGFKYNITVP